MFTGFASENTPAIQVWDFSNTVASSSANRIVYLADDCAPIQLFKTGFGTTSNVIRVYLPSSPIEGRQIRLINARYGGSAQKISIYSADVNGFGSSVVPYTIGAGQVLDLIYVNSAISLSAQGGAYGSGWVSINQGHASSANFSSVCFGFDNQASASYSVALGGNGNTASATYSANVGGQSNTASGTYSAVIGGYGITASGLYSAGVGGSSNTPNGSYSAVIGGNFNTSSGSSAIVVGGASNAASSTNAVCAAGSNSNANGNSSFVASGSFGTARSITGNVIFAASLNPISSALGVSQTGALILGRQTTDATVTTLCSNNSAASTTNQVILPNNSAYTFQGTCIAAKTAAGDTSSWKFEGAIKRGANAASTVLVAAVTPTVIAQDAGASTWVLAITADTTNGGIAVTVTGQAATTIRWVCKIETTEVTF